MSQPVALSDDATLCVTGVTKRFGGLVAVRDIALTISPGSIHGLIGPNGAGKSTTIGLISGFMRPNAGSIRFGKHDLLQLTSSAIAALGVGRTFQQATPLAGLTVYENILVGMHTRFRSSLASVLLRLPGVARENRIIAGSVRVLIDRFGLGAIADTEAKHLTFGQLRFLEIARAIAARPKVLLLDEPAAGLNPSERNRLAELIDLFRSEGTGVLLVDHDVPFVFDLCDRMTVMNFGSVIAAGDPAAMRHDPRVREAYLGSEAETAA